MHAPLLSKHCVYLSLMNACTVPKIHNNPPNSPTPSEVLTPSLSIRYRPLKSCNAGFSMGQAQRHRLGKRLAESACQLASQILEVLGQHGVCFSLLTVVLHMRDVLLSIVDWHHVSPAIGHPSMHTANLQTPTTHEVTDGAPSDYRPACQTACR